MWSSAYVKDEQDENKISGYWDISIWSAINIAFNYVFRKIWHIWNISTYTDLILNDLSCSDFVHFDHTHYNYWKIIDFDYAFYFKHCPQQWNPRGVVVIVIVWVCGGGMCVCARVVSVYIWKCSHLHMNRISTLFIVLLAWAMKKYFTTKPNEYLII